MVSPLSTLLVNSLLVVSPPPAISPSQCVGPDQPLGAPLHPLSAPEATPELEQLIADLRQSLLRGEGVDIQVRAQLRLELERLRHFPDRRASDARLAAMFTEGMLVLAASIQGCDPQSAEAWVDRALASQEFAHHPGPPPELAGLPAELVALYEQRRQALSSAQSATIWLHCEVACAVFVDGHHVPVVVGEVEEHTVLPGTHDVWIFHTPDAAAAINEATRVSATEVRLDGDDQNYLPFPKPHYVGLLPSREEWWSMWSFVERSDWAIESKKSLVNFETSVLEALIEESPIHARALAQDLDARELRVRVALHLADLWQQAGEFDAANAILDRALLWAELQDSSQALAAAVGKFPALSEPFEVRAALLRAKRRGTIEVDCRRCVAVIDGVVVDTDSLELPVGSYRIELHSSSSSRELRIFNDVAVRLGEATLVGRDVPQTPAVGPASLVPEPVDFEQGYRQNPQLQRWVWGTAGGVVLAGGVVWSFALTTWLLPRLERIGIGDASMNIAQFKEARASQTLEIGLSVTGAFFLHSEVAAYCFSHMPPARRPGLPLMSVGTGLLMSSLATAGHAITGYLSWQDTNKRKGALRPTDYDNDEAYDLDVEKYSIQQDASANVGWVGSAVTVGLALSGVTLIALGSERSKNARRDGILLAPRVPPSQRPGVVPVILGSGLLVAGASFVGIGVPALVLEAKGTVSVPALVGLIGGATLGVSGAVVMAVGLAARRKHSNKPPISMVPWASPNSAGLQLAGHF